MFGIPYVYTQSRILKVNQNFFESSTLQFVKYWLFVKVQNLEVVRSHDDRVVRGYSRLSSLLVAREVSLPRNVSRRDGCVRCLGFTVSTKISYIILFSTGAA